MLGHGSLGFPLCLERGTTFLADSVVPNHRDVPVSGGTPRKPGLPILSGPLEPSCSPSPDLDHLLKLRVPCCKLGTVRAALVQPQG